jgi:hypothetical protein
MGKRQEGRGNYKFRSQALQEPGEFNSDILFSQCSLLLPILGEACVMFGWTLVSDNVLGPEEAPGLKVHERMVLNVSPQGDVSSRAPG